MKYDNWFDHNFELKAMPKGGLSHLYEDKKKNLIDPHSCDPTFNALAHIAFHLGRIANSLEIIEELVPLERLKEEP